jgi:hypothetical protein
LTRGRSAAGYALTTPGQVQSFQVGRDGTGNPLLFVSGTDRQVYALRFDASGNSAGGYSLASPGPVKDFACRTSREALRRGHGVTLNGSESASARPPPAVACRV